MDKYLSIALVAFLLFSCQQDKKAASENNLQQAETVENTRNTQSLTDYLGVYKGVLPCADCEGIETEITLGEGNNFVKKTTYLGKGDGKPSEEKGMFSLNEAGNIITLEGIKDAPNQYLIGENAMTQLDMSGKQIEGSLSEKYILKR